MRLAFLALLMQASYCAVVLRQNEMRLAFLLAFSSLLESFLCYFAASCPLRLSAFYGHSNTTDVQRNLEIAFKKFPSLEK